MNDARPTSPPRRRRWRTVTLPVAVLGVMASIVLLPTGAIALNGSDFEGADGNLLVDGAGKKDWANINPAIGYDKDTGQGDDSFGQGTKEDTAVPTVVDGSIPNNKSDLTRLYVADETVAGTSFLYLAWERVQEPTGTTNMDFEFNQSAVLSTNGVTPVRTVGDLLITYDLSHGGVTPTFGIHRWVTAASAAGDALVPDKAADACESANTFPCWGKVKPLDGTSAEGTVNTEAVTDPLGLNQPRTLSPRTFGEAAINLNAAGVIDANTCTSFGSAYLKSRSSDTFNSALKDFIAPIDVDINSCQPATIKLKKVDDSVPPVALAGAVMQLFRDNGDGVLGAGDTQVGSNCTTTISDICTFSGITVSGTYIGHELSAPAGYDTAPDQARSITITGVAQTIELTFVDPRKHRVITLVCHEGSNTLNASAVVLGGVGKTSISAVPPALVTKGVTMADLCALGGAQYNGISGHTLITGSVTPG